MCVCVCVCVCVCLFFKPFSRCSFTISFDHSFIHCFRNFFLILYLNPSSNVSYSFHKIDTLLFVFKRCSQILRKKKKIRSEIPQLLKIFFCFFFLHPKLSTVFIPSFLSVKKTNSIKAPIVHIHWLHTSKS